MNKRQRIKHLKQKLGNQEEFRQEIKRIGTKKAIKTAAWEQFYRGKSGDKFAKKIWNEVDIPSSASYAGYSKDCIKSALSALSSYPKAINDFIKSNNEIFDDLAKINNDLAKINNDLTKTNKEIFGCSSTKRLKKEHKSHSLKEKGLLSFVKNKFDKWFL